MCRMEEHTAKKLIDLIESLSTQIENLSASAGILGSQIEDGLTPAIQELKAEIEKSR